jgi:hypothetical protein
MDTMMMSPKPPTTISRLGGQDVIARLETVVDFFDYLARLDSDNKAMRFIIVVRDQTIHFLLTPLTLA